MTIHIDASTILLGEHCLGISKERMIEKITGTLHKCFKTGGFKICNPDFHQASIERNYSYVSIENGITHSLELPDLLLDPQGTTTTLRELKTL